MVTLQRVITDSLYFNSINGLHILEIASYLQTQNIHAEDINHKNSIDENE